MLNTSSVIIIKKFCFTCYFDWFDAKKLGTIIRSFSKVSNMTKVKTQEAVSSFLNKNITVGSLNIQGGFKTTSKLNDFESLVKNCHIFCLQET